MQAVEKDWNKQAMFLLENHLQTCVADAIGRKVKKNKQLQKSWKYSKKFVDSSK